MSALPHSFNAIRAWRIQASTALVGWALSAFAIAQTVWPTPQNTNQAGTSMSWKTHCVGRVMMSLPEDRKLTWFNQFDNAEVKRLKPMAEQQFWDGVEAVRQRYLSQKHEDAPSLLAHFEKVGSNAAFIASYESPNSFWGPVLERFVYFNRDHAYEMRTGGLNTPNVPPTPELFRANFDRYIPILSRMQLLEPGQFPSSDGLCVDGALVPGDTGRNANAALVSEIAFGTELVVAYRENLYKVALYSGFEDVQLDEDRAKSMLDYNVPEGFREFKLLRKRNRLLAGLAGQEFVTRTTLNDGHVYYRMQWTIKGELDGGVLKPLIVVHLDTPETAKNAAGHLYDTLPSEIDLLKLWDFALSTFKWRAGALPDGQQIQAVN
jgi:hypothetical protein